MGATRYDAVVIGAGPAGCMAAYTLARRGVRTLVVEKASKGRWKVCGCCLGPLGQRVLREAGLEAVLGGATAIKTLAIGAHSHSVQMRLDGFVSVSRESLDGALADAAQQAGAEFRWNTSAFASPDGVVTLGDSESVQASVVVDASGLKGQKATNTKTSPHARIGLGLTTPSVRCEPHVLSMAVARSGYLGRVVLPDGCVDFAAAVSPAFLRSHASPTSAMRSIWQAAGFDPTEVPDGSWRGTPVLTRKRAPQQGRILRVGDAAGYVEPFTGEGMSWAMHAASNIAEDTIACIENGPQASRWANTLHRLLATRHARCRAVACAVRSPMIVRAAIGLASLAPRTGNRAATLLSGA
ncbi:MAG: NAD(P)/FAD-dependent oxidoreductase [Phycisphaerales bacterium JB064]